LVVFHPCEIIKNQKSSYINTRQYINKKFWDEENRRIRKSHPDSVKLNNLILSKIADANNKLLDLETSEDPVSASEVKQKIIDEKISASFFDLAKQYLDSILGWQIFPLFS
jgi:hypothetical protein